METLLGLDPGSLDTEPLPLSHSREGSNGIWERRAPAPRVWEPGVVHQVEIERNKSRELTHVRPPLTCGTNFQVTPQTQ